MSINVAILAASEELGRRRKKKLILLALAICCVLVVASVSYIMIFTSKPALAEVSWNSPKLISAWWWWFEQYGNYELVNVAESELRTDLATLKNMSFNSVCSSDKNLELAPASASVEYYEQNTVTPQYAKICQEYDFYVILVLDQWNETNSYHQKYMRNPSEFGKWIHGLGQLTQKYPNIIGILFDDAYRLWNVTGDEGLPTFHNVARTNLDAGAGRSLHIMYSTYGTHFPTVLNGQKLTSVVSGSYFATVGQPDAASDPEGTDWVGNLTKYYDPTNESSTGPVFNCQVGELQRMHPGLPGRPAMLDYSSQADKALECGFKVFQWYCWHRCSDDYYGDGFKIQPQWWTSIRTVNEKILG